MCYSLLEIKESFWNEYYNQFHWIPFFVTIGILIYFSLFHEPPLIYICLSISFTIILLILWQYIILPKYEAAFCLYLIIIFFLIQLGFLSAKIDTLRHIPAYNIKEKFYVRMATARIHEIIIYPHQNICFLIEEIKFFNFPNPEPPLSHYVKLCGHSPEAKNVKIGDRILIKKINFKPLSWPNYKYDYQAARNNFFKNIIGSAYAHELKIIGQTPLSFIEKINSWRYQRAQDFVNKFGVRVGGILAAITVGNRMFIPEEVNQAMKQSSIFHLIAISGLHISFISLLFFQIILRVMSFSLDRYIKYFTLKKIALIITLALASIYLIISGITISAQRAFIMFAIFTIISFRGNQVISKKILILAILFILLIEPHEILNPGLQMSILAVASLIFFDQSLHIGLIKEKLNKNKFTPWINKTIVFFYAGILSVTLPHLAVIPANLYYFNQTSTYAILANLIAIPLMTIIIAPLIIINLILLCFSWNNCCANLLSLAIKALIFIGEFFAKLPWGYWKHTQISFLSFFLMIFGLLWFLIWQKKWRFYGLVIYITGLAISYHNVWPDLFIYNNHNKANLIMTHENNLYIANPQTKYYLTKNILEKNKKLNFINLKDIDHIMNDKNISINNSEISIGDIRINREDLMKNGSHNIFIKKNKIIVITGADYVGMRPWNYLYDRI